METTKTTKTTKEEDFTFVVIGCAIEVHRLLGPGLLESAYEQCLAYELAKSGLRFKVQAPMPLEYKEVKLDCGYRLDFLIEDSLILELKAVDQILKIHHAQLLTYMKLASVSLGLIINFNSVPLKKALSDSDYKPFVVFVVLVVKNILLSREKITLIITRNLR